MANSRQWSEYVTFLLLRHSASCRETHKPSQVDGPSDFKLLGGAFTRSLLKLASIDVRDKTVDLHCKHIVPLRDHCCMTCKGKKTDTGTNVRSDHFHNV